MQPAALSRVRAQEATQDAQVAGSNVSPPWVPETKAGLASGQEDFLWIDLRCRNQRNATSDMSKIKNCH